jgi:hypothetical protein
MTGNCSFDRRQTVEIDFAMPRKVSSSKEHAGVSVGGVPRVIHSHAVVGVRWRVGRVWPST